jgi:tetratricopeptide (TPR) repeat protein
MREYTSREVADLIGIPIEHVRTFARAGMINARKDASGRYRFSFQDLVLLRAARSLRQANLSTRKIWRALRAIRARLPAGRTLASVRIVWEADQILVKDQDASWEPLSGQEILDFSVRDLARSVAPLVRGDADNVAKEPETTAQQWYELGVAFEVVDANKDAEAAYRRALALDSRHQDSLINLGRLSHADHRLEEAEALYRRALSHDAHHVTALFNLAVLLEDQDQLSEALASYQRVLELDPQLADAHFNLSRIYEHRGEQQAARRHLASYRRLTRNPSG